MKPLVAAIAMVCAAATAAYGQSDILIHQDTSLYVYGTINAFETGDSLPGAGIVIRRLPGDNVLRSIHANERGEYAFYLGRNDRFRVTYTYMDRVAKHVEIDAASVPDSSWHGGMAMEVTIALLQPFKGSDDPLFDKAIGRSRYDPKANLLEWDLEYTERMREKVQAFLEKQQ